eukprot:g1846.t1
MSTSLLPSTLASKPLANGFVRPSRAQGVRRRMDVCYATDRPVWYPGNDPPAWLDGTLPGDYGFDPLGLGSDPETLKWFFNAELVHGRFAMMGTAGILIPGLLTKAGILNVPNWYEAGKVAIESSNIPFGTLLVTQLFLMGWAETKRYYDIVNPGSQGDGSFLGFKEQLSGTEQSGYPGGLFFDPFGFSKGSPESFRDLQVKEIKNGRLAMLAMLGFFCQYAATGKGPIDNLFDHLADPYHTTFTTNGVSLPFLG